jgi:probable addiction module antidote protein
MTSRLIDYQEELIQSLKDSESAIAYLNAVLADDEEPCIFLPALKDVLEAQGKEVSTLAKQTGLNRENLYRILSLKGNPKLTTILAILKAMGLSLKIEAAANASTTQDKQLPRQKNKPASKPNPRRPTQPQPEVPVGRVSKRLNK